MTIEFHCPSCQQPYRVKDELVGKQAKCRGCDSTITVPAPGPDDDDEYRVAPLLAEELRAAPTAAGAGGSTARQCPSCAAELAENAVLCVGCGFDLRKGKKIGGGEDADEGSATPKKKKKRKRKSRGYAPGSGKLDPVTLARGTAFAAGGALLGALVWAGIVIATDYHISFLAWGIGALSGVGMALGHEDDDGTLAGVIASCVALVGIMVGLMLVFSFWSPGGSYEDSDMAAEAIAEETLRRDGVNYDEDEEADHDAAYEKALADAQRRVAAMSEEQVKARVAMYEAADIEYATDLVLKSRLEDEGKDEKSMNQKAYYEAYGKTYEEIALMSDEEVVALIEVHDPEYGDGEDEQVADVAAAEDGDGGGGGSLLGYLVIFLFMFGIIRGPLFVFLAVGTAYSLGSGKMTD